jgi:hypothetical protein
VLQVVNQMVRLAHGYHDGGRDRTVASALQADAGGRGVCTRAKRSVQS